MVFIDTHIVIWLISGQYKKISKQASEIIQKEELYISPMVILELEYLYEIGRLTHNAKWIIDKLKHDIGLQIYDENLLYITNLSLDIKWTRDVFDRMIIATAMANNSTLITKDKIILKNYKKAIW